MSGGEGSSLEEDPKISPEKQVPNSENPKNKELPLPAAEIPTIFDYILPEEVLKAREGLFSEIYCYFNHGTHSLKKEYDEDYRTLDVFRFIIIKYIKIYPFLRLLICRRNLLRGSVVKIRANCPVEGCSTVHTMDFLKYIDFYPFMSHNRTCLHFLGDRSGQPLFLFKVDSLEVQFCKKRLEEIRKPLIFSEIDLSIVDKYNNYRSSRTYRRKTHSKKTIEENTSSSQNKKIIEENKKIIEENKTFLSTKRQIDECFPLVITENKIKRYLSITDQLSGSPVYESENNLVLLPQDFEEIFLSQNWTH
jgi:hypothetical protein